MLYRVIVDRIDDNNDKIVDLSELQNWIQFTQRRYIEEDVDRNWKQQNPDGKDKLHWDVSTNKQIKLDILLLN